MITSQDVVTDEAVSRIVQGQTEQSLGYRAAFRDYPLPEAVGPKVEISTLPDEFFAEDDVVEVPEGTEYPRADPEEMGSKTATTTKRGFESSITDEAVARGQLQRQLDIIENMARAEDRKLDSIAGSLLLAHLGGTVGSNDGKLSWEDLVAGRKELIKADYEPDLLLLNPVASEDLLTDNHISSRSVEMSDTAIAQGELPPLLGMNRVEVSSGGLGDHNAIMVDTDLYGYEFSEPIGAGVSSYREESEDKRVYKIRSFKGWSALDEQASVKVQG